VGEGSPPLPHTSNINPIRTAARNYSSDQGLTHVDSEGKAQMVDVGDKSETKRLATAEGRIVIGQKAFELVTKNRIKKGDVLSVAQLAGILGAKATPSLIPLCHPLLLDKISVTLVLDAKNNSVLVRASVGCTGRTGVEMEALTAVSVALLTVYDMCKAVTQDMVTGMSIKYFFNLYD